MRKESTACEISYNHLDICLMVSRFTMYDLYLYRKKSTFIKDKLYFNATLRGVFIRLC
jgi:hypothetical protein